jgi:Flp pilus assembly protein TadG
MRRWRVWRRWIRNRKRGAVTIIWALACVSFFSLTGLAVDFARVVTARADLQSAADGAVLLAERMRNESFGARTDAARVFFETNLASQNGIADATLTLTDLDDLGHRARAEARILGTLTEIMVNAPLRVNVKAEALEGQGAPVEVALVLDNTGSMANDMDALRDAAGDLVNIVFDGAREPDDVHVAVVPFVAQVNIGNQPAHMAWMDSDANAAYHGELLEDRQIAWRASAGTNNCTSLSTLPYPGYSGPYRIRWVLAGSRCLAMTPAQISHFELFNLVPNTSWKGCVEARPAPFDYDDTAPGVDADTKFVPYFWMDQVDGQSNSYLTDSSGAVSGATMSNGTGSTGAQVTRAHMFNVFKYRGQNGAITTTAPSLRSPNRGCPTPVQPLTNQRSAAAAAVQAMTHWNGGGTNQAEGLAWGWRVLSPTAPFTEGAPYGERRKVLVLMTDGQNTNVGSDPVFSSDYSSLSHLGQWTTYGAQMPAPYRRPITSSSSMVSYINTRQAQLCADIKAQGIEVFTVIFREPDTATRAMLRACASDDTNGVVHAFAADSDSELAAAFAAIGQAIGQLRLSK